MTTASRPTSCAASPPLAATSPSCPPTTPLRRCGGLLYKPEFRTGNGMAIKLAAGVVLAGRETAPL